MKPLFTFLLTRALPVILVLALAAAFFARGPNFQVDWTREVPSKESLSVLSSALQDPANWPIFHHALKKVAFTEGGKVAVFQIEPVGKEWKRFEIRAEVIPPRTGESFRFRLTDESTGKTTKLLDGFEWWVGLRPATETESKHGYQTYVMGGASAVTKTGRSRFFGRFAPSILMNQLYQIDLVKLANYTANKVAKANGEEPVYQ
jgi:hypothetical protein